MKKNIYLIFFLTKSLIAFSEFVLNYDEQHLVFNELHSLTPPFYQNYAKYWHTQNVTFDKDSSTVVLTPHQKNKDGSVWNKVPITTNSWKILLKYSAYNNQKEVADGIALWYVPENSISSYRSTHYAYGGPSQIFTGLMIVCDSYRHKNDTIERKLLRSEDEAAVIVVYNEKERLYDWDTEGFDIMLGRCLVKNRYRNDTKIIATLAVEYVNEVLRVYHSNPQKCQKLELCVEKRGLKIPSGYVLGVSATNGGITGVYKVHSLKFYDDNQSTMRHIGNPTSEADTIELRNSTSGINSETEKLWTYIYIITSSLGLVILILTICLLYNIFKKKKVIKEQTHELEEPKTPVVTDYANDYDYNYYSNANGLPASKPNKFATRPETNSTYDNLSF